MDEEREARKGKGGGKEKREAVKGGNDGRKQGKGEKKKRGNKRKRMKLMTTRGGRAGEIQNMSDKKTNTELPHRRREVSAQPNSYCSSCTSGYNHTTLRH